MTDTRSHFRFLNLPKELRLMVLERLPVKVQHLSFADPRLEYPLHLVWPCIPGIAILSACRQINAEATAVLCPLLRQLRDAPLRIVTTITELDYSRLKTLVGYISKLGRQHSSAIFEYPYPEQLDAYMRYCAARTDEVHVQIAVRDVDKPYPYPFNDVNGWYYSNQVHYFDGALRPFRRACEVQPQHAPVRHMRVLVRPALWLPQDFDALANSVIYEEYGFEKHSDGMDPQVLVGDHIGEAEWEMNWAEGERQ